MQKQKMYLAGGFVLVAVVFFFVGMNYGKNSSLQNKAGAARGQFSMVGSRSGRANGGAGFVGGQIISKDASSITVQLPNNGGSKIVILAPSSQVLKSTAGTVDDLAVGTNVIVNGTANADGSVTAQNVQIRPMLPAGQQPTSGSAPAPVK